MSGPKDDGGMPGPLYAGVHAEVSKRALTHGSVTLKINLSKAQYRAFHAWLTNSQLLDDSELMRTVIARVLDQVPMPPAAPKK